MASEVSTIQSLKAVDAWIDVINANINGGVRTAFKSSRLKFSGSNVDVARTGNATSLPLQFPEPGLTTANTVIDWTQGAITASTENTHLAIQGEGFFLLMSPDAIETTAGATFGCTKPSASAKFMLSRDGEFRTNQAGLLVHSSGYYVVTMDAGIVGGTFVPTYANTAALSGMNTGIRALYNDIDNSNPPAAGGFASLKSLVGSRSASFVNPPAGGGTVIVTIPKGRDNLRYSTFGSTVYDFGYQVNTTGPAANQIGPGIMLSYPGYDGTNPVVLSKSLEASNASMTQSVPELSLAQKLFSALTKVLQTKQTNVDGVLNLVR